MIQTNTANSGGAPVRPLSVDEINAVAGGEWFLLPEGIFFFSIPAGNDFCSFDTNNDGVYDTTYTSDFFYNDTSLPSWYNSYFCGSSI